MKKIQVTRYKCDWCKKSGSSKKTIEQHEEECPYDPSNKACKTCKHWCFDKNGRDENGIYCAENHEEKIDDGWPFVVSYRNNCRYWEQK